MNYRVILGYLKKVSGPPVQVKPFYDSFVIEHEERFKENKKPYWYLHHLHDQELDGKTVKSLNDYGGDGYTSINNHLRGTVQYQDDRLIDAINDHVNNIDKAFDKCFIKQNLVVFRGLTYNPDAEPLSKELKKLGLTMYLKGGYSVKDYQAQLRKLVGFTFVEKGYMSTSVSGGRYADIVLRIKLRQGDPAIFMNSVKSFNKMRKDYSRSAVHPFETEVLLPRDTEFRVLSATVSIIRNRPDYLQYIFTLEPINADWDHYE